MLTDYSNLCQKPTGDWCGIMPQIFTVGLFVGLDATGYKRRYCYEHLQDAVKALHDLDGKGDLLIAASEENMGLDATWYRGLKKRDDVIFDGDGEPTNVDSFVRPYVNDDFPLSAKGVEHRAIYEYVANGDAFSGAYSAYNRWRDWLAKLAGYPESEYEQFDKKWKSYAASAWNGLVDETAPFYYLVNFSDCEGVIGPAACAKLAKDFAEWDGRAQAAQDMGILRGLGYYEVYLKWRHAFEQAADGGCVTFH